MQIMAYEVLNAIGRLYESFSTLLRIDISRIFYLFNFYTPERISSDLVQIWMAVRRVLPVSTHLWSLPSTETPLQIRLFRRAEEGQLQGTVRFSKFIPFMRLSFPVWDISRNPQNSHWRPQRVRTVFTMLLRLSSRQFYNFTFPLFIPHFSEQFMGQSERFIRIGRRCQHCGTYSSSYMNENILMLFQKHSLLEAARARDGYILQNDVEKAIREIVLPLKEQ